MKWSELNIEEKRAILLNASISLWLAIPQHIADFLSAQKQTVNVNKFYIG